MAQNTTQKAKKPAATKAKAPTKPRKPKSPEAEFSPRSPKDGALTSKMEAFAQNVVAGMRYAEAYRAAYDASSMAKSTVQKRASELAARGDVAGRIAELRREVAEKFVWTRGQSLQVLMEIAVDVEGVSKPNERVAAVKELNAMHGFNAPQKVELGVRDLPPIEDESWL